VDVPNDSLALPEAVLRFLESPRYATISTLLADGSPHQAVVWYGLDGDALVINSRRGRTWPANLARDGRISVAVYDEAHPLHWVGLRGTAEFVRDGDAALDDIQALARRYHGNPASYIGQDRITFRVRVERVFNYGDD
jgi:PPOX class probable F420-dependent enzyme